MTTIAVPAGTRTSRSVVAGRVITALTTLFLAFDAATHLVRERHAVAFNDEIGAPDWFPVLCGAVMAVLLVAYHVRRTAVLGAILLTAYLGGATAVNIATGQPWGNVAFSVATGVAVWAGLWPRDERARTIL
ncbi:DoxX family protein [Nocardioides humi]|uniref:DoxX family protein n=1 Tax=Nocardioides humi TaxID=449461 RepID=A0ABN2BUB7_9ACTN|nr:DoxX family protein [Nocardioides humi]